MKRLMGLTGIIVVVAMAIGGCSSRKQVIVPPSSLEMQEGEAVGATFIRYEQPLLPKYSWLRWTGTYPKRWDVVVFRAKEPGAGFGALRVVGLPGETVTFWDGGMRINDRPMEMPDVLIGVRYEPGRYVVPPDAYFLLGDTPDSTDDSRRIGAFSRASIIGRIVEISGPTPKE